MPTENCRLVSRLRYCHSWLYADNFALAHQGRPVQYVKSREGFMQSMNGWVKARYIVTWMDACYWIQFPQSVNLTYCKDKKKTSSSVQGCQNSDLNCRGKTEKSSQTKLATGACKSWIFFAVDNFPPRIPVTIFPLYLAHVAGQPEPPSIWPVLFVQLLLATWCFSQV